jgi:hypothetical protein
MVQLSLQTTDSSPLVANEGQVGADRNPRHPLVQKFGDDLCAASACDSPVRFSLSCWKKHFKRQTANPSLQTRGRGVGVSKGTVLWGKERFLQAIHPMTPSHRMNGVVIPIQTWCRLFVFSVGGRTSSVGSPTFTTLRWAGGQVSFVPPLETPLPSRPLSLRRHFPYLSGRPTHMSYPSVAGQAADHLSWPLLPSAHIPYAGISP